MTGAQMSQMSQLPLSATAPVEGLVACRAAPQSLATFATLPPVFAPKPASRPLHAHQCRKCRYAREGYKIISFSLSKCARACMRGGMHPETARHLRHRGF